MNEDNLVLVYRLTYSTAGQEVSPGHLWGTIEAIASLGRCVPVYSTERTMKRNALDANGFFFEHSYAGIAEVSAPPAARTAAAPVEAS